MKSDLPTTSCIAVDVSYFAVYPSGRRCEVSLESLEKNRKSWEEEGVRIETDVVQRLVPIYGTVNLKPC